MGDAGPVHPHPHMFGALDWIILIAYAVTLLGIGYYYARRQRTTEEYFVGGRQMHPFLSGISVFAALFSVITYIATPGEYVQFGPVLAVGVNLATLPFLQIGVGWILIPAIMRLPITSTYELFESRLGRPVRRLGATIFVVTRLAWMSLILYIGSALLVNITGADAGWKYAATAVTGAVTIGYTFLGGIRTVIVTEVVQFFILLLGAVLTMGSISSQLGGLGAWWPRHWEAHWPRPPFFSFNPHIRITLLAGFLSQFIWMFCAAGSDQASVQRFLTLRDAATARRAYLIRNFAAAIAGLLLTLTGAALVSFFHFHPQSVPAGMSVDKNGDAFFPFYIGHFLPPGVAGLVVAGIMAAAMSGFSSGANSVVTVIATDFLGTDRPGIAEIVKVRSARLLTLGVGALAMLGSVWIGSVRGDLLEVAGKTVNLLICPLFGLFFLAVFVKFSTPFGAVFGALYSAAAAVLVAYWDVFTGLPQLSFLWVAPVSLAVSIGAGCFFSLAETRGRSAFVLAGYSAAALGGLYVIVRVLFRQIAGF